MRHSWAKTGKPKERSCARCGAVERVRRGVGGAWRREYAKKQSDEWSTVPPRCSGDPEKVAPRAQPDISLCDKPLLVSAENAARMLALSDRLAVLAEVDAGRLMKPLAGERWLMGDLLTYVSSLQVERDNEPATSEVGG